MRKKIFIGSLAIASLPAIVAASCSSNSSINWSSLSEYETFIVYKEKLTSLNYEHISSLTTSEINSYYLNGAIDPFQPAHKRYFTESNMSIINSKLGLNLESNRGKNIEIDGFSLSYKTNLTETIWELKMNLKSDEIVQTITLNFRSYLSNEYIKRANIVRNKANLLRSYVENSSSSKNFEDIKNEIDIITNDFEKISSDLGIKSVAKMNKVSDGVSVKYSIWNVIDLVNTSGGKFVLEAEVSKWGYKFEIYQTFYSKDYKTTDEKIIQFVQSQISYKTEKVIETHMDHTFISKSKNKLITFEELGINYEIIEFLFSLMKEYKVRIKMELQEDLQVDNEVAKIRFVVGYNKLVVESEEVLIKRLDSKKIMQNTIARIKGDHYNKDVPVSSFILSNDEIFNNLVQSPETWTDDRYFRIFGFTTDAAAPVFNLEFRKHLNITYTFTVNDASKNEFLLKFNLSVINSTESIAENIEYIVEPYDRTVVKNAVNHIYNNNFPTGGNTTCSTGLTDVTIPSQLTSAKIDEIFGATNQNKPVLENNPNIYYTYTLTKRPDNTFKFIINIKFKSSSEIIQKTGRTVEYSLTAQ